MNQLEHALYTGWDRYRVHYYDREGGRILFTKQFISEPQWIESVVDDHWPNDSCSWASWDVEETSVRAPPIYMWLEFPGGTRIPQYDRMVRT